MDRLKLSPKTLGRALSKRTVSLIAFASATILLCLLFYPSLASSVIWMNHRSATFERERIAIPARWVSGESGHLISLEKPPSTLLSHWKSYIVVDPFAERHPQNLDLQKKYWLNAQGDYGDGKLRDPRTGKKAEAFAGVECAPTKFNPSATLIHISCISADSLLEFDFMGNRSDFSAFQEVFLHAADIARRHPGTVRP